MCSNFHRPRISVHVRTLLLSLFIKYGIAYNWNMWTDVYTGRHFDQVLTESSYSSTQAVRNTLFVLYRDHCAKEAEELFNQPHMPNSRYFTMIKHNADKAEKYIWYDFDVTDNLLIRFNYTDDTCPMLLYFTEGKNMDDPARIPTDAVTKSFIWSTLLTTVRIVNTVEHSVTIKFSSDVPAMEPVTIPEGQEKEVTIYRSCTLAVFRESDQAFIFGTRITNTSDVIIKDTNIRDFVDVWEKEETKKETQAAFKVLEQRRAYSIIYLMMLKQTPLLPKFSVDMVGYKKMKMPPAVYQDILNFYQENCKGELGEELYDARPYINEDEVTTHLVQLPTELQLRVAQQLRPIVEEWAGCQLTYTHLYGVREYYHGSTLVLHTDHVEYEVISIILQIDQNLGNGEPWPLEVIDFHGKWKNITLEAGEMLLYESASLPHGRPYPFQGVVFANAFVHYRPTDGWTFRLNDRGDILNATTMEVFDNLPSFNIDKSNPQRNILYRWTDIDQPHEEL